MKRFYPFIVSIMMFFSSAFYMSPVHAFWGGDVAVLLKILSNAVQQLIILRQTLDIAKGDSSLLRQVNRDIEMALKEIRAIQDVVRETNEIGRSQDPVEVLSRLRRIYGKLPRLRDEVFEVMSLHKFEFAATQGVRCPIG